MVHLLDIPKIINNLAQLIQLNFCRMQNSGVQFQVPSNPRLVISGQLVMQIKLNLLMWVNTLHVSNNSMLIKKLFLS